MNFLIHEANASLPNTVLALRPYHFYNVQVSEDRERRDVCVLKVESGRSKMRYRGLEGEARSAEAVHKSRFTIVLSRYGSARTACDIHDV